VLVRTRQVVTEKKSNFSDRLKETRLTLRLTQEDMGKRLDVSGNYIYLLESGNKTPSDKIIARLAELEREAADRSGTVREPSEVYSVSQHHSILTESALAAACVAHFTEFLNKSGDVAARLEWTLNELRRIFPLNKWEISSPAAPDKKSLAASGASRGRAETPTHERKSPVDAPTE